MAAGRHVNVYLVDGEQLPPGLSLYRFLINADLLGNLHSPPVFRTLFLLSFLLSHRPRPSESAAVVPFSPTGCSVFLPPSLASITCSVFDRILVGGGPGFWELSCFHFLLLLIRLPSISVLTSISSFGTQAKKCIGVIHHQSRALTFAIPNNITFITITPTPTEWNDNVSFGFHNNNHSNEMITFPCPQTWLL